VIFTGASQEAARWLEQKGYLDHAEAAAARATARQH
jgi:hypothetical protein